MEYIEIGKVLLTSLLSLVVLFLLAKLIGNRQVAELSMFDYINGISIGSIAAELATNIEDFHKPLTALIVYGLIAFLLDILTNKSMVLRRFMEGHSVLLYNNGELYQKNLARCHLDIDEFLTLCRCQGYFDLENIHTAYFEPNGKLSILPKSKSRPVTPDDLNLSPKQDYPLANVIIDGHIIPGNLKASGKDETWLRRQIHEYGISDPSQITLASCDVDGKLNIYIKLDKKMKRDIFE